MNRDDDTNHNKCLCRDGWAAYATSLWCVSFLSLTFAHHSLTVTLTTAQESGGWVETGVRSPSASHSMFFWGFIEGKCGTRKECENLMVWGSTAEMGRELVWAGGIYDSAAVLSHMSPDCRIQPWCHLFLSSVALWISQAVEGGVYFSRDVKGEYLIR